MADVLDAVLTQAAFFCLDNLQVCHSKPTFLIES
jgi:hypothetical protein